MVTLTFLGLDQYVVGHYSKENSAALADLFEIDPADLDFVAPANYIYHEGVEQTSWNVIVRVYAPEECEALEGKIASYLTQTLGDFAINIRVVFNYYHSHHLYSHFNSDYPRFITESNLVHDDCGEDHEDGEGEADPRDRADLDFNDENQLYLGNAFEGFEEKLDKAAAEKEKEYLKKEKENPS